MVCGIEIKLNLGLGVCLLAAGLLVAVAAYVLHASITWRRYGRARRPIDEIDADPQLDLFIPAGEVVERHCLQVAAPAQVTFSAACNVNIRQSAIVRSIFRIRELIFGCLPEKDKSDLLSLVDQAKSWGWGVLAEEPGRQIVFGAVTQPWLAHPKFQAVPAADFAAFGEPGYVKIAWTLCADPIDTAKSVARTETRAATTDPVSRAKFRRYWALASPGIVLIRLISLGLVRYEAEQRARSNRVGFNLALPSDKL